MIEVQIAKDSYDAAHHDCLIGTRVIGSLREAGVPVVGSCFTLRGIERGMLTYSNHEGLDGDAHRYVFQENDADVKVGKPLRSNLENGSVVIRWGIHATQPDDEL